jgi:hypothetical protein
LDDDGGLWRSSAIAEQWELRFPPQLRNNTFLGLYGAREMVRMLKSREFEQLDQQFKLNAK